MKKNNILLCGFMGCGKSTVGRILARKRKKQFCDTDIFIRKKYDANIEDIFNEYGEEKFREIEHEAVKELCSDEGCIISLGGGALTNEKNIEVIKNSGTVIFICTPEEILKERLKNDTRRPLLKNGNRDEIIHRLYTERMPIYKSVADIIIDGSASASEIASLINIITDQRYTTK